MNTRFGYCECGCGQKTWIAKRNNSKWGWKKGNPVNFLRGHHSKAENNPNWQGGKTMGHGYPATLLPKHHRANNNGYVLDHLLIIEKALGKSLPINAQTHHFPNIKNWTHLVICEDNAYHKILHVRYRALKACGHPHWRKCPFCKKYDDPNKMQIGRGGKNPRHRECKNIYQRKQKSLRKEVKKE